MTPTATPTPEVHVWNFDQDKVGEVPTGWSAIEGDWQVIADPSAPSKPNVFGLPAGSLLKSLTSALEYYPMAIETDPTEYSDFTLEAQFQSVGGRFDCSGGLIFRYVDAQKLLPAFRRMPQRLLRALADDRRDAGRAQAERRAD